MQKITPFDFLLKKISSSKFQYFFLLIFITVSCNKDDNKVTSVVDCIPQDCYLSQIVYYDSYYTDQVERVTHFQYDGMQRVDVIIDSTYEYIEYDVIYKSADGCEISKISYSYTTDLGMPGYSITITGEYDFNYSKEGWITSINLTSKYLLEDHVFKYDAQGRMIFYSKTSMMDLVSEDTYEYINDTMIKCIDIYNQTTYLYFSDTKNPLGIFQVLFTEPYLPLLQNNLVLEEEVDHMDNDTIRYNYKYNVYGYPLTKDRKHSSKMYNDSYRIYKYIE